MLHNLIAVSRCLQSANMQQLRLVLDLVDLLLPKPSSMAQVSGYPSFQLYFALGAVPLAGHQVPLRLLEVWQDGSLGTRSTVLTTAVPAMTTMVLRFYRRTWCCHCLVLLHV